MNSLDEAEQALKRAEKTLQELRRMRPPSSGWWVLGDFWKGVVVASFFYAAFYFALAAVIGYTAKGCP